MPDYTAISTVWWIAHGLGEKIHSGQVNEGNVISTGQPNLEIFDNRAEWEARLTEVTTVVEEPEEDLGIEPSLDDQLFGDSVEHLLYEDRGYTYVRNPNINTEKEY